MRFSLLAQMGKGNAQEGVDSYRNGHHSYVLRMVAIAHQLTDGRQEQQHQHSKHQRHKAHRDERSTIYRLRVGMCLVGESEIGGLHTKRQQHHCQCHIGVDVGNDAVSATGRRELSRIKRHEQIVQKTANDARQTVNSGILKDCR